MMITMILIMMIMTQVNLRKWTAPIRYGWQCDIQGTPKGIKTTPFNFQQIIQIWFISLTRGKRLHLLKQLKHIPKTNSSKAIFSLCCSYMYHISLSMSLSRRFWFLCPTIWRKASTREDKLDGAKNIYWFSTQVVMSEEFPLRNLSSSSLFLLSLSLVLVGSSGGDVEPKDRSGNSVKEKNRVNTYVASSILKKFKKKIAKESYFCSIYICNWINFRHFHVYDWKRESRPEFSPTYKWEKKLMKSHLLTWQFLVNKENYQIYSVPAWEWTSYVLSKLKNIVPDSSV